MKGWMIALCAVAGFLLLLILLYLLLLVRPRRGRSDDVGYLCDYAHRGRHGDGIPENSLEAFARAVREGCGIELDVQLCADGTVMVFHDYTLDRMTGVSGRLCDLNCAELRALSLDGTDQHIPTLEEVLALVDGRVPLLVELKGESLDTSLCRRVAEHLRASRGVYCIESFNPLLVREMRRHLPNAPCGLLYTNVCRDKKKTTPLNIAFTAMALNVVARPDFIAYNELDRGALPVKLTTGLYHAPKFVWTVRSEASLEDARKNGECAIFER